jgi:MFS family permease
LKLLLVTLFVTVSRREPVMVVGQRSAPCTLEEVTTMAGSNSGKPGVRMAAGFAYASGATGILANCFLIAFFALQASNPESGTSLGSANDLVGSLGSALMVPVALALSAWLPDRRLGRIAQVLGLSAMAVLTVGGPLLVLGVLAFEVQAPIAVAAWMVLSLWLLLINRWLRLSGILLPRLARLGEFLGAGTLAGGAAVGLGLLLPWMSAQPQLALFSVGGVFTAIGMLGTPFWFLLLGRHLRR